MPTPSFEFLDDLSGSGRAPAGVAAAAYGASMGLALLERALLNPPEGVTRAQSEADRPVIAALRKRLFDLVAADLGQQAALEAALALPPSDERDGRIAGARVPAYRTSRRLVDLAIQGLTLMPATLDFGSTDLLADLETAWRLLSTALEAGLAAGSEHLRRLTPMFAESERAPLALAATQGRELVNRAEGALSWRLGRQ